MSVDRLQNQIRKLKNPAMVYFCADSTQIPPQYLDSDAGIVKAYSRYLRDLLPALKTLVPAVRFSFSSFGIFGAEGLEVLTELLAFSKEQGYYVLLDAPEIFSPQQAELLADGFLCEERGWNFDGLLISCYLGSDILKPFAEKMKGNDRDLFVTLRTANKSASELQDLLTGSRLVCTAAADMAKRLGENLVGRCGYSRIAGVGPATSADSLLALRTKYPALFLLIDGFDYSGANAKNCSLAFDKLGHGAIACASSSVTAAWQDTDAFEKDPIILAVAAAERMKKNLNRYVTIL